MLFFKNLWHQHRFPCVRSSCTYSSLNSDFWLQHSYFLLPIRRVYPTLPSKIFPFRKVNTQPLAEFVGILCVWSGHLPPIPLSLHSMFWWSKRIVSWNEKDYPWKKNDHRLIFSIIQPTVRFFKFRYFLSVLWSQGSFVQ